MKRLAVGLVCLVVTGCAAPAADRGQGSAPTAGGTTVATTPVTTSVTSSAPTSAPTTTHAEVPVPAKLSPHGKDVLTKARQNGVASVVLVISTEAGATERTAAALRELGATVEATDASIGYLRASVPVAEVDRVTAVDGVRQVDVDEPIGRPDPTP